MVQQVSSPIRTSPLRSSSLGLSSPLTVPTIVVTPCEPSREPFPYMSAEKGTAYSYRTSERRAPKRELKGKTIRWVLIVIIGLLALLSQVVTKPDLFPYKDIKLSIPSKSISSTFLFSPSDPSALPPTDDSTTSSSSSNSLSDYFHKRSFSLPTSFTASFGNWDVDWSKEKETPKTDSFSASGLRKTALTRFMEHKKWSLMGRPTHHSSEKVSSPNAGTSSGVSS